MRALKKMMTLGRMESDSYLEMHSESAKRQREAEKHQAFITCKTMSEQLSHQKFWKLEGGQRVSRLKASKGKHNHVRISLDVREILEHF